MFPPFLTLATLTSFATQEPRVPVFEPSADAAVRAEIREAGFAAEVRTTGLHLSATQPLPWVSTPEWQLAIRTRGVGRRDVLDTTAPAAPVSRGERAELARPGWIEWFETSARGVRQSWTIAARPAGAERARLRISLEFEGDLVPFIADGGQSVTLKNAQQEPVLTYSDLHAWDASGRALEAHIRPSPWGIGIEVDDRDAIYPVTVDPVATPAVWSWENSNNQAVSWHSDAPGRTFVNSAGDVNGDGYSDVIVGTPQQGTTQGAVYVFHGGPSGPALVPNWSATSTTTSAFFGASVASAGDVNGDGYDDIVAGAPRQFTDFGQVYCWFGGPSGLGASGSTVSSDFSYSNLSFRSLGASCAPAGDVNGDGFDDFVVGAPGCPDGGCSGGGTGAVLVFFGSSTGPSAVPWSTFLGLSPGSGLGWSVAGAGDVNGDGFSDIAVAAPWFLISSTSAGQAYVFHGSANFATDFTADWTRPGINTSSPRFGYSIAGVGDLDGDGYSDLAVGAPLYGGSQGGGGGGGGARGRLFLFPGGASGLSLTSSGGFEGENSGDEYASSCASAGDLDGDGYADIVVGAALENGGTVYVIHGRGPAFGTVVGQGDQLIAGGSGSEFGSSVSGIGDANGDGLTDIAVGGKGGGGGSANSRAQAFLGRLSTPGSAPQVSLVGAPGSVLGTAIATAGTVDSTNQNARSDFLVGIPDANAGDGQVQLRLGNSSGLDTSVVWTSPPLGTGARAGTSVAAADVDNDGRSDVLIGCPDYTNGQALEGRVVLFLGTNTGALGTTSAWTFESNVVGARLGSSIAFAGDVNGDGYNDVILGAPADPTGGAGAGSAYLFLGGVNGLAATPSRVLRGLAGWQLGTAISTAGDVNRDGFSDLLIGSPGYVNGQIDEGRVDLYLGSPQGLTPSPNGVFEGDAVNARFGASMAAAGDVNNDGYADILIGSPFFTPLQGRVFVYRGIPGTPPAIALPLATTLLGTTGQPTNTEFGASVAGIGDVNGDGFADIAVGAPDEDAGGTDRGAYTLFFGSSSGVTTVGAETTLGAVNNAFLGRTLAPAGDLNADGFADFGTGAPGGSGGSIDIVIGGGPTALRMNTHQRRYDDLSAILILGSPETTGSFQNSDSLLNSSGNPSTPVGRAVVALQWEHDLLSTLFDGAGLSQTAFSDVALHPIGSPFQGFITGLSIQNSYHWRSRFLIRNPYQPHTRWLTMPGNAREEKKLGTGYDCNNNGTPDALDLGQPGVFDCNGNAWPDSCDIATGFSADFDSNTIPDSCDIATNPNLDCNVNGVLDASDLASMTSLDCNGNSRPDECDIALASSNDCDGNSIPDECDVTNPAFDCNGNSIPDSCDISSSSSPDTNGDAIPDECQGTANVFCFGDGSGTACPCGNSSPPGNSEGCASSIGVGGRLRFSGVPSVSADNLMLLGTQMPNSSALYFQGTIEQAFGSGIVFGDGKRCAAGTVIRLGTKTNVGNSSQYPAVGDLTISVKGVLPVSGGIRTYQIWYRNAAAFCTASTFNLTNGLSVTWAM